MEIHHGTHLSPLKDGATSTHRTDVFDEGGYGYRVNEHRQKRRKSIAGASERAPLHQSFRLSQETAQQLDRHGSGPGKENLNPSDGITLSRQKEKPCGKPPTRSIFKSGAALAVDAVQTKIQYPSIQESTYQGKGNGKISHRLVPASRRFPLQQRLHSAQDSAQMQDRPGSGSGKEKLSSENRSVTSARKKLPCRSLARSAVHIQASMAHVSAPQKMRYPSIHDDISQPQMFTGSWLEDMESVTTQPGGCVLEASNQSQPHSNLNDKRLQKSLIELYQDQSCLLLYQQLRASLEHRALSLPQEFIQIVSLIRTDIGLQMRFISLWTEFYDASILQLAAEVALGRELADCANIAAHRSLYTSVRGKRRAKKSAETSLIPVSKMKTLLALGNHPFRCLIVNILLGLGDG